MAYPTYVLVTLEEVNGNSCGTIQNRMVQVGGADPPAYEIVSGGDFNFALLQQVTLSGGQKTWGLIIAYFKGGSCNGYHSMRRTNVSDDPTGTFCAISGSAVNCGVSQASVIDDD